MFADVNISIFGIIWALMDRSKDKARTIAALFDVPLHVLQVDEIVARLQCQTVASKGLDGASEARTVEEKKQNPKLKYLGVKKVSREELHEITERLNKPTKMSTIRERRPLHLTAMPEVE